MHADHSAAALIETMKLADKLAQNAINPKVRKAAAQLRDKAFAKWVWG